MLSDRFKLEYINEKGKIKRPALIHRAPLGSLERWVGLLIEHYAGAFPLWLSPVQIAVLPISDKQINYSTKVKELLEKAGIRVELSAENKTIGAKIRESSLQKIPYMIIIGKKESQNLKDQFISVRSREGKDLGMVNLYEFIEKLKKQIEKFL